MKCMVCGENKVFELLDLGMQPVCNRFPRNKDEKEYRHPLILGQCSSCGLIQLVDPFPLEEVALRHGLVVYSEPEEHLDGLAETIARLPGLDKNSRICGVSFKDASLAERMERRGFKGSWVLDPRKDLGITHQYTGPELIQEALNQDNAEKFVAAHEKQDVVIVRHLLEHAYKPREFMEFVKSILKPNGYVVMEVPDCAQAISQLDHSTIWEEHTLYFTEATFKSSVCELGLSISDFRRYHYPLEGSLVCIARLDGKHSTIDSPASVLEELALGKSFSDGFPGRKKALSEWLSAKNGKLAFFGAGHLACVFINIFGMKDGIRFVIDDNPVKKGLLMPGSKLPIVGSEALLNERDGIRLCLLGVNPRNEDRVVSKNGRFLENKGKFLSIFPSSKYAIPILKK